ncbi:hypothetical protein EBQ74_11525 [bacterium]|nr:hypothetical protein [bacterium]
MNAIYKVSESQWFILKLLMMTLNSGVDNSYPNSFSIEFGKFLRILLIPIFSNPQRSSPKSCNELATTKELVGEMSLLTLSS